MEALFNLYYFCLFVTKNHVFVLYFLSGEEVGGNARDNRGTGAAMQCRWSAAAPGTGAASRASEGASRAPPPRSKQTIRSISRVRRISLLGRTGPSPPPSRPSEHFPGSTELGEEEEEKEGARSGKQIKYYWNNFLIAMIFHFFVE